ncbi:beta-aspartyl-peptidase [Streptomyces cinnamoneus]|uniref:Beta-aspartyl-peptidase n=1 Tax=Streptomyces cinnamoneus TaxID=53446 RepID=A0A2G1XLK6_STRCJ|nr:isoaspartyl peptidase/L-asparaginase [Streptomyces cinnamoneus]PHQ52125.1 beta-aspartyl-peptidase [Streptomyces cinnamoneus]PPT16205.1 isoaspartyl peptidase/L-asparaginase [Streptomyces cinnamoneus]
MRPLSRPWTVPALALLVAAAAALPGLPQRPAGHAQAAAATAARTATDGGPRPEAHDVVLAVHGGAGSALRREDTDARTERAYRDGLADALRAGQRVLRRGGDSVSAVEEAVRALEDNPLFNAGKGAVFTEDAGHELDASIMRGSDLRAGAVTGVRHVRNPVSAARLVMERTPHVLLAGEAADTFAVRQGLTPVTQDYFWTQQRWDELMRAKKARSGDGRRDAVVTGTVGAVAVDASRSLAAATSTGGMTNKMAGRVGDSPVVGAGTYAKNGNVAVSATGQGEVFLRGAAAATISHLVEFGGRDLAAAAYEVVVERLPRLGGKGGVIALDDRGTYAAPRSSDGMLHGYATADGRIVTKVFPDE